MISTANVLVSPSVHVGFVGNSPPIQFLERKLVTVAGLVLFHILFFDTFNKGRIEHKRNHESRFLSDLLPVLRVCIAEGDGVSRIVASEKKPGKEKKIMLVD